MECQIGFQSKSAQDALSAEKRTQFQEMVEADMVAKPVLSQMTRDFDIDVFNVPEEES